jgi:4-hydroxybenzoate polyprenyltransferase
MTQASTAHAADRPGRVRAVVGALRPGQWSKNVLVFLPLILAHAWDDPARWRAAALAFCAWSLLASLGYVLNDLLDRESDRRHPRKCSRPFASGALSTGAGLGISVLLAAAGGGLLAALPRSVAVLAGVYLVVTVTYSAYLKRLLVVDVLVLAGLYTLRLIVGGAAVGVPLSMWLIGFSVFLFLSLAMLKRYAELRETARDEAAPNRRRGYRPQDLPILLSAGPASGYVAVLVVALYLNSEAVRQLYAHPPLLWAMSPLLLYWITRLWFLAHRGQVHDDPLAFASRDGTTYVVAALGAAVVYAASAGWFAPA